MEKGGKTGNNVAVGSIGVSNILEVTDVSGNTFVAFVLEESLDARPRHPTKTNPKQLISKPTLKNQTISFEFSPI